MPDSLIWVDGVLAPSGAMHLSALDRGFTLADGLFETMRLSNGVIFRPGSHLGRLHASARRMALPIPANLPRMIEDAARSAADAGIREARLRLTISRGTGTAGLAPPVHGIPTCIIAIAPRSDMPDDVRPGLAARIASGRRNEFAVSSGMKTLSYTDSVIALADAHAAGADEAVFLDTEGHVSEGSASNLFLLRGETLCTPPLSCAALPGITRAIVMEIADSFSIAVDESPILPGDLYAATEVFLTSSIRGIAPLRSLDGRTLGSSCPGRLTQRVSERYRALIAEECRAWPSAGV